MNVLIYCREKAARAAICRHLIQAGQYQTLIAETMRLTVAIALENKIKLVVLFDPENIAWIFRIKEYLIEKRPRMRVLLIPSIYGQIMEGWEKCIDDALRPVKPRKKFPLSSHPRFQWKPGD